MYTIKGKVIKGNGYGRKLGFSTVNLEKKINDFFPGIYAGKGILNKKTYTAAIVIDEIGKIEAHLLGYKGNAYGKKVILKITKFLRKFIKFKNEADLIKQIKNDIKLITIT